MELDAILFWILAVLTGGCAIAVVVTQNIVRAATWLIFTLAGTAGIFFLLGAEFIGSAQLLVYVGGTLVLVIFGVMLTAQGRFIHMKASAAEWGISLGVGLLLYGVLAATLWTPRFKINDDSLNSLLAANAPESVVKKLKDLSNQPLETREVFVNRLSSRLTREELMQYLGLILTEAQKPGELSGSAVLGAALLGSPEAGPEPNRRPVAYLLPFEIVSVHLLVVMIGAAYLARAKRRRQTGTGV